MYEKEKITKGGHNVDNTNRHKCYPKPTSTYGLIGYQCGCGLYFDFGNVKKYLSWMDKNHKGWRKTERGKVLILNKLKELPCTRKS